MHVAERVHPDDLPAVLDLLARARHAAGLEEAVVVRARHKDGSWRRLEVTVFSRTTIPPWTPVCCGCARSTTSRQSSLRPRSASSRLAEALPVGVLSADAEDFLVFTNDAALGLFKAGFDQLRGRGWLEQIHPDHRDAVKQAIVTARSTRRQTQTTLTTVNDEPSWLQLLVVPLAKGDRYVGWVATVEDVTDRLSAERELAHRATHDPLTGLPNRWLVMDRLQQALARCVPGRAGVCRRIRRPRRSQSTQRAHGHAAGDAILVDAAHRIQRAFRAARYRRAIGGDEFVVVSERGDDCEGDDLAERLRNILDYEFTYAASSLRVTASVGLASSDDPTVTPEQLLAAADAVMYRHKFA